jgi:hypothetical protein
MNYRQASKLKQDQAVIVKFPKGETMAATVLRVSKVNESMQFSEKNLWITVLDTDGKLHYDFHHTQIFADGEMP